MLFTVVGLWLSYSWNLTSGASIILVAGAAYLLSLALPALPSSRARVHQSE
jgi:zinc transport system permease protein